MKAFDSELIARVHLIRVPWHLDRAACDELAAAGTKWKDFEVLLHVFDFSQTQTITPAFYRTVNEFKTSLHARHAALVSINASTDILKQLERDGMVQLFSPQDSMKDAITELGLYKQASEDDVSVDLDFFKPLEEGLRQALKSMGLTDLVLKTGTISPPLTIKDPDQLAVVLGAAAALNSNQAQGQVALYFHENVLREVFEKITQQPFSSADAARVQDLVRELLNIALGHAKAQWRETRNFSTTRSLPQTVVGDALQEHIHGFIAEASVLPLSSSQGTIYIGVCLKPNAVQRASTQH